MRAVLLLVLILCCIPLFPPAVAQDAPERKGGFTCGLSATYIFLNRAGHHVDYDVLVREFLKQQTPDSLLAIKSVLEMHGCRTAGIKVNADYFLGNPGPAIVYLQLSGYCRESENHFAYLVSANRQTGAKLLDPVFDLQEACYLTWDSFSRSYQGVALIPND